MNDIFHKDILSSKEDEVLNLMMQGMSNREIGDHLKISINTVKSRAKNIFKKLNVKNRTQACIVTFTEKQEKTN